MKIAPKRNPTQQQEQPTQEDTSSASTLTLTASELPQIADWQEGQDYDIVLTVKMISMDGAKASFQILSANVAPEPQYESEQDELQQEGQPEQVTE